MPHSPMVYGFGFILFGMLLALSVIDIRTFRLPDALTFPLIIVGLVQSYMLTGTLTHALIGAVAGYLAFVGVELAFKHLRGIDGLGRGDAKLLAGGGAWCGWSALPFIVLIGSLFGIVALLFPSVKKHTDGGKIPFGPFLAFGIMMVWSALHMAGASVLIR